jgi:hypothetical protein
MKPLDLITRIVIAVLLVANVFALQSVYTDTPIEAVVEQRFKKPTALDKINHEQLAAALLTKKSNHCLTKLIHEESRGNPDAQNPTSTAKGLGQLLDGTYKNIGMKHSEHEAAQLVAMLAYIGRRYGAAGPCGAWDHWKQHNWY